MGLAIRGIVPVIPTPFDEREAIDIATLQRAVDFAINQKMAAICLPAYGSEFYKLSEDERELAVATAIGTCAGRVPVIAQANHPSGRIAVQLARRYQQIGADVISFALPRQFVTTESDLLSYCGQIADAISCPVLIQDFNPGGPTVSAEFIATVSQRHENIAYFKLEEPMILDKLVKVRRTVGDRVGILGGWGGYYMLESMAGGMCGFMPGLAICDLFDQVFRASEVGDRNRMYQMFSLLLPYIAFSLQDFEMFLLLEKRVLRRRGIFVSEKRRAITRSLSEDMSNHADFLIDQLLQAIKNEGFQATL